MNLPESRASRLLRIQGAIETLKQYGGELYADAAERDQHGTMGHECIALGRIVKASQDANVMLDYIKRNLLNADELALLEAATPEV